MTNWTQVMAEEPKQAESALIRGSPRDRTDLLQAILSSGNSTYNQLIKEVMLFDDDPTVRTLCFYIIARQEGRHAAEDLLEVLATETSQPHRESMLDMFKIYASQHNIRVEQAEHTEIETPSTAGPAEPVTDDGDEVKARVLEYIYNMTADIPIAIHRLAQLLGVDERTLKGYLREFVKLHPDAAQYLEFEQVFVKTQLTVRKMIDPSSIKTVTCMSCKQETTEYPCDHCGEGQICITCKLPLSAEAELSNCPNCQQPSHRKHLLEWVRIKGSCPHCRGSIRLDTL